MYRVSGIDQGRENNQLMVGTVVSNNDPLFLGRIKVRIPYFHKIDGLEGAIEDKDLPWIHCGLSYNRYIEVGSKVFILAENGDSQLLSYIGVVHRKEDGMLGIDYGGKSIYGGAKYKDSRQGCKWDKYFRDYISDSRKGDVIYNEHQDEKETIGIVDRIGNWIKLISPVSKSANKNNSSPSIKGAFDKIAGGITGIFLRGIGTSIIQMIEKSGKSEVVLGAGKGKISITDDITLSVNGSCSITINDSAITLTNGTSSIKLDGSNITLTNGNTSISMAGNITVEDPSMTVNGNTFVVNAATSFAGPVGASPVGPSSASLVNTIEKDKNF